MFVPKESLKSNFLQQKKTARDERANEREKEVAVRRIQICIRRWLSGIHFTSRTLERFDQVLGSNTLVIKSAETKPAEEIFWVIAEFLIVYNKIKDRGRMELLYNYLVRTLENGSIMHSYAGILFMKHRSLPWISLTKKILHFCMHELRETYLEFPKGNRSLLLRLHTLVSFTSTNTWAVIKVQEMENIRPVLNGLCSDLIEYLVDNGFYGIMKDFLMKILCKRNISSQPIVLKALFTMTMRPMMMFNDNDIPYRLLSIFLINVFSVPAFIYHIKEKVLLSNNLSLIRTVFITNVIKFSISGNNVKYLFSQLGSNSTLYLLANIVHLTTINDSFGHGNIINSDLTLVFTNLLKLCQQHVTSKKSNTSYWHPILGWFEQPEDHDVFEVIDYVKQQLPHLWTGNLVLHLICTPLENFIKDESLNVTKPNQPTKRNFFHLAVNQLYKKKNNMKKMSDKFKSPNAKQVMLTCSLYYTATQTLREMKSLIITGLCYQDRRILYNLWLFLRTCDPAYCLERFLNYLAADPGCKTPEIETLMLFCDCMTHYITILDDIEMYEDQDPFQISDFVTLSHFLNQFLYKSLTNQLFDINHVMQNPLFTSLYSLMMTIYRRDSQRKFCKDDHWLIKEARALCLSDPILSYQILKGKEVPVFFLSKMPHIFPHSDRISLFRKFVAADKMSRAPAESNYNSSTSTLITIHRSRIVEDGYRQLSVLSLQALKGIIRVRFINEQGLDEAGIDQDGVFKEFLEETIRRVFDPSFKLFKVTTENRLYPSSTSSMQDNHLLLFEFIGRMLGKAVYEGIVVDVPFASFFVSQFCGQTGGTLYSWVDELASLDQDLYRNLMMVKHYEEDVGALGLTFSVDENVMGELVTYELKPGGKAIAVTDENRINYIHLMAKFRMYVQIKDQVVAFTRGFRSIINPDWLPLFSTPEWLRLISGDDVPLDLRDLRRHTQYFGGFHDRHRVICWLWDTLEKDFSEVERSLFLKFVTSCSKSPLLGFAHLEPPFSIRCIEVSDDEDVGDTVGSVMRGFFTIQKNDPQNRLPTSSTCFNLLKLPNYQKKSTLREKLRYAVRCNTGFELS